MIIKSRKVAQACVIYGMDTSCMNCRKQAELNSLRSAVKRFEDGREFQFLSEERDKAVRKFDKSERQRLQLTEENQKLRTENRSLSSSGESLRKRYDRLLSAYDSLQEHYRHPYSW